MANTFYPPFETVQTAAESLVDPLVKSQLLSEIAQQQLAMEQFDAALQTFAAIPDAQERRIALLVSNFSTFPPEMAEPLVKLLESAPQTEMLAGRIALGMLEVNNTVAAWQLIETADEPFDSEQQQYDFLEKVLPLLSAEDWNRIPRFYRTFVPGTYRDWATWAIVRALTKLHRYDEAEKYADTLVLPLRHSWAYWEMSRLSPKERAETYFDKAVELAEEVEIVNDEEETMEILAVQLRIFGRIAFEREEKERGIRLLERSEAAAAAVTMPIQRYRLQCFLGKVLVELRQIASITEYLTIGAMLESLRTGSDRSRVLVWLAEAGWSEGWMHAVTALAVPERGIVESERASQIAGVLKRSVAHHQGWKVVGDSFDDTVRLSGEEFEMLYFNPFAEADCGCY